MLSASPLIAVEQLWTAQLKEKLAWYALTDLGTLLEGTAGAVQSFDPDTGALLWARDDLKKTNAHNAREVPGTPYLLGNISSGMAGSKVALQAIDFLSGETVWTAEEIMGQYLATYPIPELGIALFVFNGWGGRDEQDVMLRAHDLLTGETKWQTRFAKANDISFHMADGSGKVAPRMDLTGYHDPVIEGTTAYCGFLGVHALDLTAGAVMWASSLSPATVT